jgi:site-specific DNA recombinase
VPEESEAVRTIFSLYLELGSMGALLAELDRRGIRTKVNGLREGQKSGGNRFGVGPLAHLLKNRFYIGEVHYRGEVYRGEHEPILSRDVFESVQAKLAANAVDRQVRLRGSAPWRATSSVRTLEKISEATAVTLVAADRCIARVSDNPC